MTRGTGVVGGLTDDDNIWKGEAVNIYMLKKGTTEYAYFTEGSTDAIYNDAQFDTPAEADNTASGLATASDGSIKYYPPSGNFDFWGYRLDDCRLGQKRETAESIVIPFTLDGSQDIIWGKASSDDQFGYCARYFRQAAHMTEVPNISMSHKMTRIRFATVAGADGAGNYDGALRMGIRTIKVVRVPTRGWLTVAYLTDPSQEGVITFDWSDDANKADLEIKDSTDAAFTGFADHRVAMEERYVGQPIQIGRAHV